MVREWLRLMMLFDQTTHEDRVEIDREVERRTGVYCDDALLRNLISKAEFKELVLAILRKKKRKKEAEAMVI